MSPSRGSRSGLTGLLYNYKYWEQENISTREATFISATQITAHKAELMFRQGGTDIYLFIGVDPTTDDLIIDLEGVSDPPGVVGMQWGLGNLDIQNLSVIAPVDGGRIIDAANPIDYTLFPYPFSGQGWEAQLVIVQGERGGFYVRNTDNTFQFKNLSMADWITECFLTSELTIKRLSLHTPLDNQRCGDSIPTQVVGVCLLASIETGWGQHSMPEGYWRRRRGSKVLRYL